MSAVVLKSAVTEFLACGHPTTRNNAHYTSGWS